MQMAEFIERLREVLRWEDSSFSATIRNEYYGHLMEGVEPAVAMLASFDPAAAEATQCLLEALTPAQLLDFISAPHIAAKIISPEMFRRSEDQNLFLKALGICAGCISDDVPLYNQRGEPILSASLAPPADPYRVSFGGDLPVPFMDRGGNCLSPVSTDDAERILGKVAGAGRLIQTVNENTHGFSIRHTEVLAFRYESEYPADFSSGSFQTLPGFSLICNCHLPAVSEPEVADAIIHEAIHSIIYQFEAFGEPLRRRDRPADFQVISPWTGSRLGVESFAQACLVWYGLLHFWKMACDRAGQPTALYERARKGFAALNYANICRSSEDYLSPHVASLLADLQTLDL
ncbi:hypothetical protein AYO50_00015 [Acidobacteria bacterium SCGC AG-212-P17]|nr:hypothetical protein AYO50_00015 [Acidobacteria bacterium SCGC AG-212-P17]